MYEVAIVSNLVGAAAFGLLLILLLRGASLRPVATLLIAATTISVLWYAASAHYYQQGGAGFIDTRMLAVAEVARSLAWVAFLAVVLLARPASRRVRVVIGVAVLGTLLCGLYALCAPWLSPAGRPADAYLGLLLIALAGLVLAEQLFRATRHEHRWAIKFLCLGVGGLFAYDFFLYSHAVLFRSVQVDVWIGRAAANALCVPFVAVAVARNPEWRLDIFVSRQVVFHTSAVLAAGVYLLAMALAGYYIREFGGTWGAVVQAVFLFGAVVLLLAALSSGQLRSKLRVFLVKHFYRNKYEYREEWLAFTQTLAEASGDTPMVLQRVVAAIARIIEARGGMIWLRDEAVEGYVPRAAETMPLPVGCVEPMDSSLVRFLTDTGWVVNLTELRDEPERYRGLEPPTWLLQIPDAWLVVPLLVKDALLGFVVLGRALGRTSFDWEDSDLLKTVGRQTASHLALLLATDALAQARQFEAFNRLSAFLIHDLKNVVAQLSLVGTNARRFRDNPDFVADAFETVDNAVGKMSRMLANLQKGQHPGYLLRPVDLGTVVRQVVQAHAGAAPAPLLVAATEPDRVLGDPERLTAVLSHLVQNAQEATPAEGEVKLTLTQDDRNVVIEIADTGCGMDPDFVRERLFKPFDTTKGNAGMGIGAFESREIVTRLGGRLEVCSQPGQGTVFTIRLPRVAPDAPAVRRATA